MISNSPHLGKITLQECAVGFSLVHSRCAPCVRLAAHTSEKACEYIDRWTRWAKPKDRERWRRIAISLSDRAVSWVRRSGVRQFADCGRLP